MTVKKLESMKPYFKKNETVYACLLFNCSCKKMSEFFGYGHKK